MRLINLHIAQVMRAPQSLGYLKVLTDISDEELGRMFKPLYATWRTKKGIYQHPSEFLDHMVALHPELFVKVAEPKSFCCHYRDIGE